MKPVRYLLVLAGIACMFSGPLPGNAAEGDPIWKPLADGKTLAGWHKNGEGEWTVEEGAFVGRSNKAKLYGHLVSDATFRDFTVRFRFQCPSGDSGFFIRTKMEEPDKTLGLQVQVGPCGSGTGGIYESYGRGWLPKQPAREDEQACYREGKWNEMIIAAYGNRVTVHVNGIKMSDLTDNQLSQEAGVFALQMHSGVVNETRFKDLAILQQGEIVPKTFLNTTPAVVKPADDKSLSLHAASGAGSGPEIRYMPEWGAFGDFTDADRIVWPVEVPEAGLYDVWLEWAVADEQAGHPYVFSVGDQQVSGTVGESGSPQTYQRAKIGQLQLQTGTQRAAFGAGGTFDGTLLNLRQVTLVPAKP